MALRVFADDLSGAMECGAILCASEGVSVELVPAEMDPDFASTKAAQVTCLDIRYDKSVRAESTVLSALRTVEDQDVVYFKIDSALRGNVKVYISALKSLNLGRIGFVGALPSQERVVRGGEIYIADQKLADSSLWELEDQDPPRDIAAACGVDSSHDQQFHGYSDKLNVVIADLVTQEDIDTFASTMIEAGVRVFVGTSAGLRALAKLSEQGCGSTSHLAVQPNRLLTVAGSGSEVTRTQVANLEDTALLQFSVEDLHGGLARDMILRELEEQDAAISIRPVPGAQDPQLASHLATVAAQILKTRPDLGVVATGGETASFILQSLAESVITVRGEVEPSVVWGNLSNGRFIAIKPGSHGSPDALEKVRRQAHTEKSL